MTILNFPSQVYSEPICRRHHARLISGASAYRAASWIAAVVLSLLLTYAAGGFWIRARLDLRQPEVHYSGDALLVLEVGHASNRADASCCANSRAPGWISSCV
jgi:Transmembrane protein 231